MKSSFGAATLVAVSAALFSAHASAASERLQVQANAVATCQGHLASDRAILRQRPLAIQNDGAAAANVSCSFTTATDPDRVVVGTDRETVNYFGAYFSNNAAVDKTVTCTGIVGFENRDGLLYLTQSVVVPANRADQGGIFFDPAASGLTAFYQLVSMSCTLPSGTAINDTYVEYNIDDSVQDVTE